MQFPRDDPSQNKQTKKSIKAPQTKIAHDGFIRKEVKQEARVDG